MLSSLGIQSSQKRRSIYTDANFTRTYTSHSVRKVVAKGKTPDDAALPNGDESSVVVSKYIKSGPIFYHENIV